MTTLELLTRQMPVTAPGGASEGPLTITATVATATPVRRRDQRGAYLEVLDPAALDLGSLDVPLLDSHDRHRATATIGRARNFRLEDGAVVADLTFSTAQDVSPIVDRVRDGTLTSFSVGYSVAAWRDGVTEGTRTRTATAWTIQEVSLVAIPADPNAKKRGKSMALDETNDRTKLVETLRKACSLSEDWATRMIDSGLTEEEIREALRRELEKQREQAPRIRVHGSSEDPATIRTRQADAVAFRMVGGDLPEASRDFVNMTLRDMALESLQRAGEATRGLSTDEIFTRAAHGTSDFPLVVSNAMGKVALDSYRAAESPLKRLARQRTLPNFKPSQSIRLGEMGRMEEMSEQGEFTHTSRAETGESMSLKTFGRAISVSRKLLIDDDLNMLGDMTSAIGQAAAQTEADELVSILTSNPNMADGNPVFFAARGNLAGAGTSIGSVGDMSALDAARQAMRKTKGLDGKTIVDAKPRFLLVGPDHETAAERLMAEIYPATVDDANPFASRLELIVEPRLEDSDDWWLFADPARVPALQFAYLQSAQGVQIQRKEAWSTLGMEYRAFLDFGCGWSDWRGAYKNPGDS
ncbi:MULTISPECIES: phage major capsid protein [Roseobacteraceae]|uniref:phage major capsid protein n=1 Tax=Roseobacteraceae TaxID=2854170 RepID=UPI003A9885FE